MTPKGVPPSVKEKWQDFEQLSLFCMYSMYSFMHLLVHIVSCIICYNSCSVDLVLNVWLQQFGFIHIFEFILFSVSHSMCLCQCLSFYAFVLSISANALYSILLGKCTLFYPYSLCIFFTHLVLIVGCCFFALGQHFQLLADKVLRPKGELAPPIRPILPFHQTDPQH